MSQNTITVGGVAYDMNTGLPVQQHTSPRAHHKASQVHSTIQKSKTLNRRYVAKQMTAPAQPTPTPAVAPEPIRVAVKSAARPAPQHKITKFAPHPSGVTRQRPVMADIAPTHHPLVERAVAKQTQQKVAAAQQAAPKPSAILKNEAIAEATDRTLMTSQKKFKKQGGNRAKRTFSLVSASLAFVILGGYFTYLSMPSISTRVAAVQAGVDASYPSYKPSGYSLSGPVAFSDGTVTMKFAANAGSVGYTLTQASSGWDSSAVLDRYVQPKAGDSYLTTTANGLTIYTFGSRAAWVNGGILYTIDGNAPLSTDQIQRIATSV